MDERYICYCGLYCQNCSVKVKILPAATVLRDEMIKGGFGDIIDYMPEGAPFWKFLNGMVETGICVSCYEGGGDPGCKIRICAREKGVKMCAFCNDYPCTLMEDMLKRHPVFRSDNELLRNKGLEAWAKVQDDRRKKGFTYQDEIVLP